MDRPPEPPINRFVIAAVVDRLIYDSETVFDPEDARVLLAALPSHRAPWFELGIAGKFRGPSTRGYSPGIGSVKIKGDNEQDFQYSTAQDTYVRAGQWKLQRSVTRGATSVEIEQVMADVTDEGRGARIRYTAAGEPVSMDIRINRTFALLFSAITLVFPGWKPWKLPENRAS